MITRYATTTHNDSQEWRQRMYRWINENCEEVIGALSPNGIDRYLEIQRQLRQVNVSTDQGFQRLYRNHWRMNVARLNGAYYSRYFARMESLKGTQVDDISMMLREIATPAPNEQASLQFSFATKLVNTLDPRAPVYDRFVATFYYFISPPGDKPVPERLEEYLTFYAFLREEYNRIVRQSLLDVAIRRMRDRFAGVIVLPDERIIDVLIWAAVSMLQKGAQRHGRALYR
jgi:hypothetical protein